MKNHSVLKLATSVVALTSASFFAQVAYGQAASPASANQEAEQANAGDSLAADAQSAAEQQAQAQATLPPSNASAFPEEDDISSIVVTGTAIRGVAPVGSATVDISRDTIIQSGLRDASSLIAQLPQGSGLGNTAANNSGRSSSINLRGLGNNATLLLFDGHRTVAQNRNQLTDPNLVPFSAVDRVEVVTDGASAIYGSDAVAGVVNYILRRPFDGAELTARYTNTLYDEVAVDMVAGSTWSGGGIVAAFSVEANTPVRQYDIPQLRYDLTPYGGNDNRFFGTNFDAVGSTGALLVGSTVYGLPADLNGRTPTAAELEPLMGQPEIYDGTLYETYYSKRRRYSALVRIEQDLGNLGEITLTGIYSRRTNQAIGQGDGSFQTIAINLPSDSPYYVDGLGGSQRLVYNFRVNNPDRPLNRNDHLNTGNILVDYRVPLFADFRLTVSGGYGKSEGCEVCQPQANTILTSLLASPENAGIFNPYIREPQPGAEKIFGVFIQNSTHQFYNLVPKIDGALFTLPGGDVRIAAGGEYLRTEYLHHSLYSLNPTTTLESFRFADTSREVYSAFGEVFIPVFGPDNAIPGFQRLDLNAAIRHDEYSDVGSTTNPKFGVSWEPFNDLLLRGSYGTSFRAPNLSETNFNIVGAANRTFYANNINLPGVTAANGLINQNGQSLVLASSFRFAQLRPETATIMSAGADYTPSYVPGLKLGVTYYSVDYKDRILALPNANTALSNPETFALYEPFFTLALQPDTCVNGSANGNPGTPEYATYNPLYLPYLNAPGSYPPTTANDCNLIGIIDTSTRNLGRVKQSGLDFVVNYERDVSFGTLSFDGSFTKILELKRNVLPGTPLVSALDRIGEQVSSRGRASVGLRTGAFSGNIGANYVGGYLNNQTPTVDGVKLPDQDVPAWTTFDLNVSYAPDATSGVLSGTRFTVSARNFTDKDPPIVLTSGEAVDLDQHNVFGRIITLEVSKEF